MVISFATQVIVVRTLTKADFGAFAYAFTLAAAARILLSLGQGKVLSQFLATYEERRDYNRMFGAILLAFGTTLATSAVTIGTLFLLSDSLVGTAVDSPAAADLLLILIFLSPLEALDQIFVSLFAVLSKPRAIFFRKYLLTPALRLAVVVLLVLADASVTFLAVGYLVGGVVGVLIYMVLLFAVVRERGLLEQFQIRKAVLPFRAVFSFSVPLITGELVLLSLNAGSVLILGMYHSVVEVAAYRAVYNPARLNVAVTTSFVTLFLPVASRLHARSDLEGLRHNYWHTAMFMAVLTFPIFALTGPLAHDTTVALFGTRYSDAGTVLAILALGYYLNAALGFNYITLQVLGRVRFLVCVNVLVIFLNLGLSFFLIPRHGAIGAATANCAALTAQSILNQLAMRRSLDTQFIGRAYRHCYLLIMASAAALWALSWLHLGLMVNVGAAAIASTVVIVGARHALDLGATFPELQKVPGIRRLVR